MKDRNLKAQIYLNENTQNSLKNCQLSETKLLGDSYLIKCKFTQNDVDFIGENNNNESLFYDVLCGDKQSTSAIVHKLDKTRYPIFRVKSLILPEEEILRNDFKLYMVVDIEGSVSGMKGVNENSNSFVGFIKIFNNNQLAYQPILFYLSILEKLQENLVLECSVQSDYDIEYDNVQLLPYYSNLNSPTPFEFIIKDNIQVFDYDEAFNDDSDSDYFYDITFFITSESKFIQSSLLILLFLVLIN